MSHRYLQYLSVIALISGLSVPLQAQAAPQTAGQTPAAQAGQAPAGQTPAAQAPAEASPWVDRAEYDLVQSISAEKDNAKKIELITQWEQKYPTAKLKKERMQLTLDTYRQMNNGPKVMETAKRIVAEDPKNAMGLYYITAMTPTQTDKSEATLAEGERAANALLGSLDEAFADSKKPATTSAEQWKMERNNFEVAAHKTLAYIAVQRKNTAGVESEYKEVLKLAPNDAATSYALGAAILGLKDVNRYGEAIYHIARATSVSGTGGMDAATKGPAQQYLKKIYSQYHGSDEGLNELLATTSTNALPPADFKIKSNVDVANEANAKLEEEAKNNPELAIFRNLKTSLQAPEGEAYFDKEMKGAKFPKTRGKIVSTTPATRPTQVVVSVTDATTPEVTLKFATPLPGKADPGTDIQFAGVASSYTKEPFMLMLDAERSDITGWPAAAAPAKSGGARPRGRRR